jgi:hypothetical protein
MEKTPDKHRLQANSSAPEEFNRHRAPPAPRNAERNPPAIQAAAPARRSPFAIMRFFV